MKNFQDSLKQQKHCILKKNKINFKNRSLDHFRIVFFICCASHKVVICVVIIFVYNENKITYS